MAPPDQSLIELFLETRERTMELCAPLKTEDYIPQAALFASPVKWHLAHTTWFFEEMILSKYAEDYKVFHQDFCFLFNSYYNSIGERTPRADRGSITRPTVAEVKAYRIHVDTQIQLMIQTSLTDEIEQLLELGIQHEQQHQELLMTDLKYLLSRNPTYPQYRENGSLLEHLQEDQAWISHEGGISEIGFQGEGFSFDNEHVKHRVFLEPFAIQKDLVSNGEFIEFIEAGGYQNHSLWLDEGWAWVQENQMDHPLYWVNENGTWSQFTLGGLKSINPKAILGHISYYEAQAFATWKGCRLPTEFEWEAMNSKLRWGLRWEWTNSAYLPYPNYKIPEGAVGEYNGKFMINQMVLRGGSVVTAPGHTRATYRNFFHPQYQWQYSGIRLAKSL